MEVGYGQVYVIEFIAKVTSCGTNLQRSKREHVR